MKKVFILLWLTIFCLPIFAQDLNKAKVDRVTKLFSLRANIRKDHQIIGYAQPNLKSIKLICISIFTYDVEPNKFHCPLGAYYDTNGLPHGDEIYFNKFTGRFAQMKYIDSAKHQTIFYIKRKLMEFED